MIFLNSSCSIYEYKKSVMKSIPFILYSIIIFITFPPVVIMGLGAELITFLKGVIKNNQNDIELSEGIYSMS
jgi:hypothetical protein